MRSVFLQLWRTLQFSWGAFSMMVGLAALAAVPGLNFLTLGYLLESGGRVARTGRLRDGWPGLRKSAILGLMAVSCWLFTLPVRFVSGLSRDIRLIGGESVPGALVSGLFAVMIVASLVVFSGIGMFLSWDYGQNSGWRGNGLARIRDGWLDFIASLRLPHYFWLGLRGWLGGLGWLALPAVLLALAARLPGDGKGGAGLLALAGGAFMIPVTCMLPFTQVRFAQTCRMVDLFDWRKQRQAFRRAPLACATALTLSLVLATPLYLLKVELMPRELAWIAALFFIAMSLPSRLAAGWALGRANARDNPCRWFLTWPARILCMAVAAAYSIFLWFTLYLTWEGAGGFFTQHAFLLPAPPR